MTDDFSEFPSILWKIKDIALPQTKISPTISFMEIQWKLKLNICSEPSVEGKIDLLLVRLMPSVPLLEKSFQIRTGIQHTDGNYYMSRIIKSQLKNKYLCVWTDSISNIKKSYGVFKDVTFYFRVDSLTVPYWSDIDRKKRICSSACLVSYWKDMRKLGHKGEYADVVLKCGNKQFPAHRAILAARSSVFAAMFRNDMKEAQENFVEIKGMEPDVLHKLLRYMYSGMIADLTMDSVREIYLAADMYDIEPLTIKCSSLIIDKFVIDPKNDSQMVVNGQGDVEKADDDEEQRELLKELFQSIEWQTLALRYPKLARDMCKPFLT